LKGRIYLTAPLEDQTSARVRLDWKAALGDENWVLKAGPKHRTPRLEQQCLYHNDATIYFTSGRNLAALAFDARC